MSSLARYRELYEHEKDCNRKMLAMIESVPETNRGDARFQQAINIACHLAACRENWLHRMTGDGLNLMDWFEEHGDLATLRPRYAVIEGRWTDYLGQLDETGLVQDFHYPSHDGRRSRWNVEGQIIQLCGHANYHRGQVALLVDQLGGETVDTDYLYWVHSL